MLFYGVPVAGWLFALKCLSPVASQNRVKEAKEALRYYNERNALAALHWMYVQVVQFLVWIKQGNM
jgi:hypothetical protein